MALNAYLKQAAQLLRRAAVDKRQEISELRRQADNLKREEAKRVNEIKLQEQQVRNMMGAAHRDNNLMPDRGLLARQLNDLMNAESNVHKEVSQRVQEINNEISNRDVDASGLEHQATDFDSKAGMSTIF